MIYHTKDKCRPLLPLGDGYRRGLELYDLIAPKMTGRLACTREVCGVIGEVVSRCDGHHVEIGALFGGTAILAAKIKKHGKVYAIDPLNGYYGESTDVITRKRPSPEILRENMDKFGVELEVCAAKSYPWPLPETLSFDTAFIDGDHSPEGAGHDWESLKHRTRRYVIFDNYDTEHPGVIAAVRLACINPNWRVVLIHDLCAVLERVA